MKDTDCIAFLQWVLPKLHLRWAGFRKVRRQVCKRIERRVRALELGDVAAYRRYLETHPAEWQMLDGLCRITISRFFRDRQVFACLETEVLPALAVRSAARGRGMLRMWSAGCASGEEPYSLALLWHLVLKARFPAVTIRILATDTDTAVLERARRACYAAASLRELPAGWRDLAFKQVNETYCLKPKYRAGVDVVCHDVRTPAPDGPFDLILCRNLAFTYFDLEQQQAVLSRLWNVLVPGGALVIGAHETLPEHTLELTRWAAKSGIFVKGKPPGTG